MRSDSNTGTAKYVLKLQKAEKKQKKYYKPDLYAKPNLTSGKNGFNVKGHASISRLKSKVKRRPNSAAPSSTHRENKRKNKRTGNAAAKFVRSTYTRFVRMLAEHYAEEEHESILQRVKEEAGLSQRQMIMKDYTDSYEKERE